MKNKKNNEYSPKSYLVEANTFSELGDPIYIPGVVSIQKCQKYAKPNHRMCEGRGVLNFDDAKVFIDKNGNRQVLTKWRRTCNCVSKKLEQINLIG